MSTVVVDDQAGLAIQAIHRDAFDKVRSTLKDMNTTLSHRELGELLSVPHATVGSYIRGEIHRVALCMTLRLALRLDIPVIVFVGSGK